LIDTIDREDDSRLVAYRHVGDPHWLNAHGLFVAEGRLVVERLLGLPGFAVESLLLTPAAQRALETLLPDDLAVYVSAQSIVNGITGFNFHRGCLALVRRPGPADLSIFSGARRLVVLEGIGNPDNVGGIFRSAAALGVDGIVLDPDSGDPFYRKSVRTSMGAVLRLPFVRLDRWPDALDALHEGFTLAALSPTGATTIDEFASALPAGAAVALLAGAEGAGLSRGAMAQADVTVRIPIDVRSDSLNVVMAVSIALHVL
jgi:tRNA G18 (ribose-2'-O)-methylase SpoU